MPKKNKGQPRQRQSAGRAQEPAPQAETKKDIEERQQALKAANAQRSADRIAAHARAKLAQPTSVCDSHSLVPAASGAGEPEKVADLSEHWVKRAPIDFLAFLPQDNTGWYGDAAAGGADGTMAESARAEVVAFCNEDCARLLKLPHAEFWSHVLHNTAFGRFKDTYLRHATRYFDGEWTTAAALAAGGHSARRAPPQSEGQLARRVFMVLLRMSQWEEDEAHFMTREQFGELVYDQCAPALPRFPGPAPRSPHSPLPPPHPQPAASQRQASCPSRPTPPLTHRGLDRSCVWDVPSLLDLATIYGAANPELTAQMIDRVFSANPKYGADLADAVTQVRALSAPCSLQRTLPLFRVPCAPSLACWPFGSSLS